MQRLHKTEKKGRPEYEGDLARKLTTRLRTVTGDFAEVRRPIISRLNTTGEL